MLSLTTEELQNSRPLNCVIVEDIPQISNHLNNVLKMVCPEVNVIDSTDSVKGILKIIKETKTTIDLIFLDIHLTDGIAFQAVPEIKKKNIEIVFCTAHMDYSVKAFHVDAAHYLMKPLDPDAIKDAVERVKIRKAFSAKKLPGDAKTDEHPTKKLILNANDGTYVLDFDEIYRLKGENNYTDLWLTESKKKLTAAQTLKKLDEQLEGGQQFYRIHKSHIINLNFMSKIVSKEGFQVIMKDGTYLPVAKRRIKDFRLYLENWKG